MADPEQPPPPGQQHPAFQVRIPVEWSDEGDVPLVYANQVLVTHSGPEFFIVFGVLVPPPNPTELPDILKIKPQVRVAVARDAMPGFVQALNENLRRYQEALSRATHQQPPRQESTPDAAAES
jgi:hypothetical protein